MIYPIYISRVSMSLAFDGIQTDHIQFCMGNCMNYRSVLIISVIAILRCHESSIIDVNKAVYSLIKKGK